MSFKLTERLSESRPSGWFNTWERKGPMPSSAADPPGHSTSAPTLKVTNPLPSFGHSLSTTRTTDHKDREEENTFAKRLGPGCPHYNSTAVLWPESAGLGCTQTPPCKKKGKKEWYYSSYTQPQSSVGHIYKMTLY